MDAMIVLPRPGGHVNNIPMVERERYIEWPDHPKLAIYNSTLDGEGTAVSISKDNGKTWSRLDFICRLGRMHAHLLRLPNGALLMGYILRQDLRDDGTFTSYNRGLEALISHDNGLTWDQSRKYVIDTWPFVDPKAGPTTLACGHACSVALDDGRVISAYGHYPSKSGVLIRWKPDWSGGPTERGLQAQRGPPFVEISIAVRRSEIGLKPPLGGGGRSAARAPQQDSTSLTGC